MLAEDGRTGNHTRALSIAAGIFLAIAVVTAGWDYWLDVRQADRIAHDNAVVLRAERVLSTLKDAETGQRGFLLTGEEPYLSPYTAAIPAFEADTAALHRLVGERADKLIDLARQRLDSAGKGIEILRTQGRDAAMAAVRNGRGKALMDQVRGEVADLQLSATASIGRMENGLQQWTSFLRVVSLISTLLAFGIAAYIALKRRREHLRSSALLAGVFENAPVGLGFLDASLRVEQINGALAKMSERALSAALGASIWDVMPQLRDVLTDRLQAVVEGGRPISNVEVQAQSTNNSKDIREYQVSFYPLASAVAPSAKAKSRAGVGMVITDVTSRKRAERWLRESEERFRTLTQSSSSMIWITDAAGAFIKAQPEWQAFTGQEPEASMLWGWLDAVHPDDRLRTQHGWEAAIGAGVPFTLEHRLRRHDGTWRHMDVSAAPILDPAGGIREWIGSHTDVSERKEAEIELSAARDAAEAANRAKSVFLANMSHELRTPLSAVIGYCEMLEEEVEELGEASLLADLGKIKSNARHLLSLINDVLDLSKIEANRMDVFAEDIDVATLATDVVSTVDALVKQKNNMALLELDPDLGAMTTDVVKLRQCLFNLLSNAAKFTENGTIKLAVSREQQGGADWVTFRVIDTGIGMTPEQLQRLFARFSQADETTTRRFGGTGLGLAISRAFSRLMGGDISVDSIAGEGTTFSLRIPAIMPVRPEFDETADTAAEARPADAGTRDLILVIDDDPAQRDLMSRFLERQNFAVETASDGRQGLERAKALKPRAILLDVMMPQMDGWSVLSALKRDPDLAGVPVVMITFVSDNGLAASLGADEHLAKPVDWSSLSHIMDRFHDHEGDVLVVDDDRGARERLRSVLEKNGWTVQEAANGAEALERVAVARPRLILLDLTMPVMDGFVFLDALRKTPFGEDIPVVVLSARDISNAERKRLAAADRVLSKGETSLKDIANELRVLEHTHYANDRGADEQDAARPPEDREAGPPV
ncbi:response regulator [Lichenihabitans psoromatis]|uniref:response regulator n=1 Tax=Lichenihabitans psoromatis TaxID=2528642 RepID=UPI0013F15D7F|nr:response regulator [Lichenihabitans psoromatis]